MATKFRGFRALGIVGFAALTVTMVSACNVNASGSGTLTGNSNNNGPAATSTVAVGGQVSGSGTNSGNSGATATPAPAATAHPATAAAATSPSNCLPVNLTFALGDGRQTDQDQWVESVDMTNHSSATCTMDGVPGVTLIGDTDSQPNYAWTLVNSSVTGSKVTLRPGATAHFDLAFLSGDLASGGGDKNVMTVQRMVITTPGQPDQGDATVQGNLQWAQSVVFQDGATHPGTYVMPVASGS